MAKKILPLMMLFLCSLLNAEPTNNSCEVHSGVDIDTWCKRSFGHDWSFRVVHHNVLGLACAKSDTETRSIDMWGACRLQYNNVIGIDYRDFNDPFSWYCRLDVCR